MPKPSLTGLDSEFEELLQTLEPNWKKLMVELKAFSNPGKLRGVEDLARAIFLYCGADLSLREVAAVLTLSDQEEQSITDEGVRKRLHRCVGFLEALVKRALGFEEIPSVPEGYRILCVDGTTLGDKGFGKSKTEAMRLHLCIDLLSLHFVEAKLSSTKTGETLRNFSFGAGDLVLHDRGYAHLQGLFFTALEQGAAVLGRWNHANALYRSDSEQELKLFEELKHQGPGSYKSFEVLLKCSPKSKSSQRGRQLRGWLHCYRLSEEQAAAAKRRTQRNHDRKSRKVSERTALLCQFVLVFTTLSPEQLSAEAALALYRVRWQVELAIKRLKSVLKLSKIRSAPHSPLSQLYVQGKLLYLLMIEKKLGTAWQEAPFSLGSARSITPWRPVKLLKRKLDTLLLKPQSWKQEAFPRCIGVLMERSRARALQTLPQEILQLKILERLGALAEAA